MDQIKQKALELFEKAKLHKKEIGIGCAVLGVGAVIYKLARKPQRVYKRKR